MLELARQVQQVLKSRVEQVVFTFRQTYESTGYVSVDYRRRQLTPSGRCYVSRVMYIQYLAY